MNIIENVNIDMNALSALMNYAQEMGIQELHFKFDPKTGLKAIIALHSLKNGPALGGCRCIEYDAFGSALYDAIRLARGMSYKAAIAQVSHGGGKAVLLKPKDIADKRAYFRAFGEFVHQLNGRYITAVDSGTTIEDMDLINEVTPYLASSSQLNGDPSTFTADGVLYGIEAAAKFKLDRKDLKGLKIAIQGLGHVGYLLAEKLHQLGAQLIIADVNQQLVEKAQHAFNAQVASVTDIHQVECDIFAPCALGGILNDYTIATLKAKVVAGCANNQLGETRHGQLLHDKGILYAPDYVINAGGLIYAATKYHAFNQKLNSNETLTQINNKVKQIGDTLCDIFKRSTEKNRPTSEIVDEIAAERL